MKRIKSTKRSPRRLDARAWVRAGRHALIGVGIAGVRIAPLAQTLGVTSGSFYWHFASLPEFLDRLLVDWETTNTASLVDAVRSHPGDGSKQFDALVNVWMEEKNTIHAGTRR